MEPGQVHSTNQYSTQFILCLIFRKKHDANQKDKHMRDASREQEMTKKISATDDSQSQRGY